MLEDIMTFATTNVYYKKLIYIIRVINYSKRSGKVKNFMNILEVLKHFCVYDCWSLYYTLRIWVEGIKHKERFTKTKTIQITVMCITSSDLILTSKMLKHPVGKYKVYPYCGNQSN